MGYARLNLDASNTETSNARFNIANVTEFKPAAIVVPQAMLGGAKISLVKFLGPEADLTPMQYRCNRISE